MFNQSSQHLSFHQQIIALHQGYPCPRCSAGSLELYGLTETFRCTTCQRAYVPLRGGRLLYPALRLGWKIAPTFWWDGFRWHWAGTTATAKQLTNIVFFFLLPIVMVNLAMYAQLIPLSKLSWCSPSLISLLTGLVTVQLIYFLCWDFDFVSHQRKAVEEKSTHES